MVMFVLGGMLGAAEKQNAASIEPRYRAYRFRVQPTLNPKTTFRITELDVPGLWPALGVQLFIVDDRIDGQSFSRSSFLHLEGAIHPFINSFGGQGVMSGVVAGDAFYYSYSWGSGIHRSHLGRLTIVAGKPVQQESKALFNRDMFVEPPRAGRIRIVEAQWQDFNQWEGGVIVGWIDLGERSRLRIVDEQGREVELRARW